MNRRAMVRIPLALAAFVLLSGQYYQGFGDLAFGCVHLLVTCATDKCPWDPAGPEAVVARTAEERLRLANAGDTEAQFNIYAMGEALSDDGYLWLCRSASGGHNLAQLTLMKHYIGEGRVPRTPDYLHAYIWLRLFEGSVLPGTYEQTVHEYKMEITNWLTRDEIATADALVRDWQPDPVACAARAVEQMDR